MVQCKNEEGNMIKESTPYNINFKRKADVFTTIVILDIINL